MPKAVQYRPNSIIFFAGDPSDQIYILNAGKVSLNHDDLETGQEIRELIKTGEFFGVRSALGRYPRDETAIVLATANVIVFTVPEFETLVSQNTRVIMRMLKVFSNQLRRIHHQVQNLLSTDQEANPEEGLYKAGEYYRKNKRYGEAVYASQRYLVYYPGGKFADEVQQNLERSESYLKKYENAPQSAPKPAAASAAGAAAPAATPAAQTSASSNGDTTMAKAYYDAITLMGHDKYQEALDTFQKIVKGGGEDEYIEKSWFEIGRCHFFLERFDEAIKTFSGLLQKYPKHSEMGEALLLVGRSHAAKGDKAKATSILQKLLSMVSEGDPVRRKTQRALRALGDAK